MDASFLEGPKLSYTAHTGHAKVPKFTPQHLEECNIMYCILIIVKIIEVSISVIRKTFPEDATSLPLGGGGELRPIKF